MPRSRSRKPRSRAMRQTREARKLFGKKAFKQCSPDTFGESWNPTTRMGPEGCSWIPPHMPNELVAHILEINRFKPGVAGGLNAIDDRGKWALWFLTQFLANPTQEKTETYEALLLRLYHISFDFPADVEGLDDKGFAYPLTEGNDEQTKMHEMFMQYLKEFYRPANAAQAARFEQNLVEVHQHVTARRRHELLAAAAQDSQVQEYNLNAKNGEPIQAARTMCGRVVLSGGRLWFAKVPVRYDGMYDASKTCSWQPLSSHLPLPLLKAILGTDMELKTKKPTSKIDKEQKIAKLTVELHKDLQKQMQDATERGDLAEAERFRKQIPKAHATAKKMLDKQIQLDEQYNKDQKKMFMTKMQHDQHACVMQHYKVDGYTGPDYNCNRPYQFNPGSAKSSSIPFIGPDDEGAMQTFSREQYDDSVNKYKKGGAGFNTGRMYRQQASGRAKNMPSDRPFAFREGLPGRLSRLGSSEASRLRSSVKQE